MSVGTEIRYGENMDPDLGWEEELNKGWNRQAIVEEGAKLNLKFQVRNTLASMGDLSVFFRKELCNFEDV